MPKKKSDEVVLTAEDKERELELLRKLHENSEALEAHAERRRDTLAKLKEQKAAIMESNRETNAELHNLYHPAPLDAFANKQKAKEEQAAKGA